MSSYYANATNDLIMIIRFHYIYIYIGIRSPIRSQICRSPPAIIPKQYSILLSGVYRRLQPVCVDFFWKAGCARGRDENNGSVCLANLSLIFHPNVVAHEFLGGSRNREFVHTSAQRMHCLRARVRRNSGI